MIEVLTILLEHPVTFVILVLCFLGFIGMTYEFILRLFGRKGMVDEKDGLDIDDKDDPPEPSTVPKPDGPDDTLEDE